MKGNYGTKPSWSAVTALTKELYLSSASLLFQVWVHSGLETGKPLIRSNGSACNGHKVLGKIIYSVIAFSLWHTRQF